MVAGNYREEEDGKRDVKNSRDANVVSGTVHYLDCRGAFKVGYTGENSQMMPF